MSTRSLAPAARRRLQALQTNGPRNYRVEAVRFLVVREPASQSREPLSSPEAVVNAIRQLDLIKDDAKEHFGAFLLDTQHGIIAWNHISTGALSSAPVAIPEVLGPALRLLGVASLILVHNHPSGDPKPSAADIELTRRLVQAAKLVGLQVNDHIIFGNGSWRWTSLAEKRLL
jgi:DNA repair protein RadC